MIGKILSKIHVAKCFISAHKINHLTLCMLYLFTKRGDGELQQYSEIYARMINDVYGECRDNSETDEDGNIITEATCFEIEIPGCDTESGNPIIFEWCFESNGDVICTK